MKNALYICGCVALIAIAYAAYNVGFIVQELPDRIDVRVGTEAEAFRKFAVTDLAPEIRRAEDMADARVGQALKMADHRAASVQNDSRRSILAIGAAAIQVLDHAREDLKTNSTMAIVAVENELDKTNASIAEAVTVIKPIRQAAEKIDATLPLYTDCDSGVCLFNDIHTTAVAIERTATAIEKQAPATAEAVLGITETTNRRLHRSFFDWMFRRQK